MIVERNERQLARNEKRLEGNKTRIVRNVRRGGNLLLSGTVRTAIFNAELNVDFEVNQLWILTT